MSDLSLKNNLLAKFQTRRGFSLLELILAVAIFSLGSIAMATLLIDSNISTKLSIETTESLFQAKEGINITRAIRDNNWDDLAEGDHGIDTDSSTPVFSGSADIIDGKYTRIVTISDISTSTKNISVAVSWELTPSRTISTTLETVLTDWKQ